MQGDSLLTPMVLPSLPTQPSEVKGRGRGDKMVTTPFLMACCREVAASLVGSAVLPSRQSLETKPVWPSLSCTTSPALHPQPHLPAQAPALRALPMLHASPHCTTPQPPGTLSPRTCVTHDRTLNARDLTRSSHAAYAPAPAHAPRHHGRPQPDVPYP